MPAQPRTRLLATDRDRESYKYTGLEIYGGHRGFDPAHGDQIRVYVRTSLEELEVRALKHVEITVWHHIAFAFHNLTHHALYIDFVSIENWFHVGSHNQTVITDPYMANGWQNLTRVGYPYTGFGLMDELVVFPEYLSASQIMQLQN